MSVSRRHNEVIGKLNGKPMGDVISIREYAMEYTYIPTEIKGSW